MAFDVTTATADEINTELAKHSTERALLLYKLAEEEILSIGQENWDGDKKHYEAKLSDVRDGIADCEKKLIAKKSKNKCPIKSCVVNYV